MKMFDPNLVTTCNFHGREYLFKMNVLNNNLEILITDKNSGEEWQCSYNATYIENLTHKTGNFKQFDIFVTMIKSGLLRTSECVSLDLLTFEDLEALKSRNFTKNCRQNNNNRRYLIITYSVEFDRIRYPLPLEYCGLPDPLILQATIKRLEAELERVKEGNCENRSTSDIRRINSMEKKIDELTVENRKLKEEIKKLTQENDKKPRNKMVFLEKAMDKLEKSVHNERNSHHNLVERLRKDKQELVNELEKFKQSEKILKQKLRIMYPSPTRFCRGDGVSPSRQKSDCSVNTLYRRKIAPLNQESLIELTKRTDLRPRSNTRKRYSRRDKIAKEVTGSRSSSASSIRRCQDKKCKCENIQTLFRNNQPTNRSPSPVFLREQYNSRSSSMESRRSSKASGKKIKEPKHSDPDFKHLEDKIESLQKMLKRNFIK